MFFKTFGLGRDSNSQREQRRAETSRVVGPDAAAARFRGWSAEHIIR